MENTNLKVLKIYLENLQPKIIYRKSIFNNGAIKRIFEKIILEVIIWTFLICIFHEIFIRVGKYYLN